MPTTLDILKASLRFEEALKLAPYYCSKGKLTIGYGHNLEANPLTGDMAAKLCRTGMIDRDDAERLLSLDANKAMSAARRILRCWERLTPGRQAVCAEMVFQIGPAGFMGFKNTRAALERGAYGAAAIEMLDSKWAEKDSPNRARRLSKRMAAG